MLTWTELEAFMDLGSSLSFINLVQPPLPSFHLYFVAI